MISEIPYAMIIRGVALVGLWISNILSDLKVPHYLSRKIGYSAGGHSFNCYFDYAWTGLDKLK
jgi:hypothetical protein